MPFLNSFEPRLEVRSSSALSIIRGNFHGHLRSDLYAPCRKAGLDGDRLQPHRMPSRPYLETQIDGRAGAPVVRGSPAVISVVAVIVPVASIVTAIVMIGVTMTAVGIAAMVRMAVTIAIAVFLLFMLILCLGLRGESEHGSESQGEECSCFHNRKVTVGS